MEVSKVFSESLSNLVQLQVPHMRGMAFVPESEGNLMQLKEFRAERATTQHLPDALRKLVQLEILRDTWSRFERLPEHVGDLLSLRELSLEECCELVDLPLSLGCLSQPRYLDLTSCFKLERLPESLGKLAQLRYLDLSNCKELERLPDSLGEVTQLSFLDLLGCEKSGRGPMYLKRSWLPSLCLILRW